MSRGRQSGFVFTIDAMLALIPVFIIMGTVTVMSGTERIAMQAQSMAMTHRAEDAMAVMEKKGGLDEMGRMFANYTKLRDEGEPSWKNQRERLRKAANRSLNPMIPGHLGYAVEFWGVYPNGTAYLDTEVTSDNRSLTGEDRPFENESSSISMATKMVTGIEKEQPIEGAVARAWLNKIRRRENLYFFGWQSTLSGDKCNGNSCNNRLNTTMKFTLPEDFNTTNCNSAYADLLPRVIYSIDGTVIGQDYKVYINGNDLGEYSGINQLNDICGYLQAGRNTISMDIYNDNNTDFETNI